MLDVGTRSVSRCRRLRGHQHPQTRGRRLDPGRNVRLRVDHVRKLSKPRVKYRYHRLACGDWWTRTPLHATTTCSNTSPVAWTRRSTTGRQRRYGPRRGPTPHLPQSSTTRQVRQDAAQRSSCTPTAARQPRMRRHACCGSGPRARLDGTERLSTNRHRDTRDHQVVLDDDCAILNHAIEVDSSTRSKVETSSVKHTQCRRRVRQAAW